MARSGYTLPVFAVAAAKAALLHLLEQSPEQVELDLLPGQAEIAIEQVARLDDQTALAITRSDPGDNLDLTRHMPIWAKVELGDRQDLDALILEGGEGLGRSLAGEPAIYRYAKQLFEANVRSLIPEGRSAKVTIILPTGKQLAERTSNAAFGIVEGLSLLGTSGISKPLSTETHFADLQAKLQEVAGRSRHLIFCIGSNGMQVADRLGLNSDWIVQTGNWVGALLVQAGLCQVESVLLLGYQGKLIKLAGGIFNTSSHLADAKLEIMTATMIRQGCDLALAQQVLQAKTSDAAYKILREADRATPIFKALAAQISQKGERYVAKYADTQLQINTVLFDRQGNLIAGTVPYDSPGAFDRWLS
jgi:cobalt-precorrin-5B (C1)-methyltransferase